MWNLVKNWFYVGWFGISCECLIIFKQPYPISIILKKTLVLNTYIAYCRLSRFSNGHKAPNPSNEPEVSNSSHISNTLRENKMCSSSLSNQKSNSLSSKTIKYPFMNNDETKASYRNLYQREVAVNLESTDAKYRLKPEEILSKLSVQFVLELCAVVVDSLSSKST